MTAKQYLSQARLLDARINSKIQQLESLNGLANKCTSTLSGMPKSPSGAASQMEEIVIKIVDLQTAINSDIDRLVDLKAEIMAAIEAVGNPEYQVILEKRYLCFLSWEQIAEDLGYTSRHLRRFYDEALRKIIVPESETRPSMSAK